MDTFILHHSLTHPCMCIPFYSPIQQGLQRLINIICYRGQLSQLPHSPSYTNKDIEKVEVLQKYIDLLKEPVLSYGTIIKENLSCYGYASRPTPDLTLMIHPIRNFRTVSLIYLQCGKNYRRVKDYTFVQRMFVCFSAERRTRYRCGRQCRWMLVISEQQCNEPSPSSLHFCSMDSLYLVHDHTHTCLVYKILLQPAHDTANFVLNWSQRRHY